LSLIKTPGFLKSCVQGIENILLRPKVQIIFNCRNFSDHYFSNRFTSVHDKKQFQIYQTQNKQIKTKHHSKVELKSEQDQQ